jgi:hypothetical protein
VTVVREQGGIILFMSALLKMSVNIFTGMKTWRFLFLDGDIKAKMLLPPWKFFL